MLKDKSAVIEDFGRFVFSRLHKSELVHYEK